MIPESCQIMLDEATVATPSEFSLNLLSVSKTLCFETVMCCSVYCVAMALLWLW